MRLVADYKKTAGSPAVPILGVEVSGRSAKTVKCAGVIDTGASITMISPSVVGALDLEIAGKVRMAGISGTIHSPTYLIDIRVGGAVFKGIQTARFREEAGMLIGRNVINLWNLSLCGRTRRLVIEPRSANARDAWDDV